MSALPFVSPADYGTIDGTNDAAVIQLAIDSGRSIDFGDQSNVYVIKDKLVFDQSNTTYRGAATLSFDGDHTERLADVTGSHVTFEGLTFSGNHKQPRTGLVYVDEDTIAPRFRACTFRDITGTLCGDNVLNQTQALLINPEGVTGFEVVDCIFKDLIKYNDGTNVFDPDELVAAAEADPPRPPVATPPNEGIGYITGILFMPEDVLDPVLQTVVSQGVIRGCTFDTIRTILKTSPAPTLSDIGLYDDGDAIRTYAGNPNTIMPNRLALRLNVLIEGCTFTNISKRAVKLRASGAYMHDCVVHADRGPYSMAAVIDVNNNSRVEDVDVIASACVPAYTVVQLHNTGEPGNIGSSVSGVTATHCVNGFQFYPDEFNTVLENITVRDCEFNHCTSRGIVLSSQPATMRNVRFQDIRVTGGGNNLCGLDVGDASDLTSGIAVRGLDIVNGSFRLLGAFNDVDDVRIRITSNTFAAHTATAPLFEMAVSADGWNTVSNIDLDCTGMNSGFLYDDTLSMGAKRWWLVMLQGDHYVVRNFNIRTNDGFGPGFRHFEAHGNDHTIDGLSYTGNGALYIGTQSPAVRFKLSNWSRHGGGSCTTNFIYSGNASTTDVLIDGVADFRPTTAQSININNGSDFVIRNVASNTSHGTIVQHGGIATTANINLF